MTHGLNPLFCDLRGRLVDFYALFNLSYTAAPEEIRDSFRVLIKRYHPDVAGTSESIARKAGLIINGYRVLSDEDLRRDYDFLLFNRQADAPGRFPLIPNRRIHYSVSMGELVRLRQEQGGGGRNETMERFGQDVEIMVTPVEARRGAVAYIGLPAKMLCPLCQGNGSECRLCHGMHFIATTSQLEVKIPPHVDDSTVIDVDLASMPPGKSVTWKNSRLRVRITVVHDG